MPVFLFLFLLITLMLLLGLRVELPFRLFFRFLERACIFLRWQFFWFFIILRFRFRFFLYFLFLSTGWRSSCGYSWSPFTTFFFLHNLLVLLFEVVPSRIHLCLPFLGQFKCSLSLPLSFFALSFFFVFRFFFILE